MPVASFPRLIARHSRLQSVLVVALGSLLLIGCYSTIREFLQAINPSVSFRRDFFQEYLLAVAAHQGLPPYASLGYLAEQGLGLSSLPLFPHPTPHPPGLLGLVFPLGAVSYFSAQLIWLVFQGTLLVTASLLLRRQLDWSRSSAALFAAFIVASRPGYVEFIQGQLGLLLAVLALCAVALLKRDKHFTAGLCLGVAFACKFFAAPVLLLLFVKRRWKTLSGAVVSFAVFTIIGSSLVGHEAVSHYYQQVLPGISKYYINDVANLSLMTVPEKLVSGSRVGVQHPISIPPLLAESIIGGSRGVFRIALYAGVIVLGIYSLLLASRLPEVDSWLLLFCMQLVLSPITWVHGFVIALVLLPMIERRVGAEYRGFYVLVLALLFLGDSFSGPFAGVFQPYLALVPTFALLVGLWPLAIARTSKKSLISE